MLTPDRETVLPNAVRLEDGTPVGPRIKTYRGWISRDHWHAYQVAVIGGKTIALGGFQSPELTEAASALAPASRSALTMRELAEKLAVLADNSGAVQYAFPRPADLTELRSASKRTASESWPSDTVSDLGGGQWRAALTIFSRETRSYTQHWVPTAYAFTFDSAGYLRAWSRRVGEPLADANINANAARPWSSATVP